jgi:heme/copper-type cytochrome/quinol oxidase subunit 3
MEYHGIDGFLRSRASLAFDVAFLLELIVIPMLVTSLDLLLVRRQYGAHKKLQLVITALFAIAVAVFAFEFFAYDWRERVTEDIATIPGITYMTLNIHLAFLSISAVMWVVLLVQALRKIPSPPEPCEFGPTYIFWLVLLALQLFISTLTGWEFYLLAFCY